MNLTHEAALGCTTSSGLSLRHFDANPIQYNFRIKCHHDGCEKRAILPRLPRKESDFAFCFLNSSEIVVLAIPKWIDTAS